MAKVTIVVDGVAHEVEEGHNLLHACLEIGLDLPYFCWHPALGSVGACRQCAVTRYKDEHDAEGQIVMACMTPAEDGTRISIGSSDATAFRARVIEWLMANHPHDCPVCDEGGECHLQDMTVMTGHVYRRYRFAKRTYRNQYLGPFIHHEMNRCIQCYRCVRFYRDHAGGTDLDVFGSRDHVYFGRQRDGVLASPFAGNLVEVCPTGVFTDRTLRHHYVRKWDLQSAPSVCVHCGLGCNTFAAERDGTLRRILNRYHGEINGYFLCDRGRFGYEFVNSERRLSRPLAGDGSGPPAPVDRERALAAAAERLRRCDVVIGIGSARASFETSWALRRMVGADRFSSGLVRRQHRLARLVVDIIRRAPSPAATLREAEHADAVLVLGEDVGATAPRAELALRQAARTAPLRRCDELGIPRWHDAAVRDLLQGARGPLFIATPAATSLDGIATASLRAAPADIARLGLAVAHALDGDEPEVAGLDPERRRLVERIAGALSEAERPLVVAGSGLGCEEILQAAESVAAALGRRGSLLLVVPECNTVGIALLGGMPLEEAARLVAEPARVGVVIVENDLAEREAALADAILDGAETVVVIDHVHTPTVAAATVVLPATTFADGEGSLVNNEGRAQRFVAAMPPAGDVADGWRWVRDLAGAMGTDPTSDWRCLDDLLSTMVAEEPELTPLAHAAPGAQMRLAGQRVPRQPARASGRTALHAHLDVREQPPPDDPDSPLAFSMEGTRLQPPASLIPSFWAPGWNSVQSLNKLQREIGGQLRHGDAGARLIASGHGGPPRGHRAPAAFAAERDRVLLLPGHRVFGSDELSRLAPALRELVAPAAVEVAAVDAERLGLADGDAVEVEVADRTFELPVQLSAHLVPGTARLLAGPDGAPAVDLPAPARLQPRRTR